jgi:shikimate dehydrogenase
MELFTIFGDPVKHSKSPAMHNAGFQFIHFDAEYSKTLLKDGNQIKKVFLENGFRGANITVPHKEVAFKNADIVDEFAKMIGAVNTYINEDGIIKAYNTDAPGFYKAIKEYKDVKSILLLGAGGTAKAIAVYLTHIGYNVTVLNRSENSKEFFQSIDCDFYTWKNFQAQMYDMVVNSTSAGLADDNYPAPLETLCPLLKNTKYAVDCIYGKMTPFLQLAQENNITYKDGEDMLLYQGVLAFELFTSTKADNKVIEVMRKGLKGS